MKRNEKIFGGRRSSVEILIDILEAVRYGDNLISHIVFSSRLNYRVVRRYLDMLELKGFVETRKDDWRTLVFITEKGRELLRKLQEVDEVINFEAVNPVGKRIRFEEREE